MRPAIPIADLSEKEWSQQLVGTPAKPGLARTLGWTTCYHTLRSKGSASGFPDWVIVRERVIFLELKKEKGHVSDAQAHWVKKLFHADAEVYIVRPRHLEEIGHVLQRKTIIYPGDVPMLREELSLVLARK